MKDERKEEIKKEIWPIVEIVLFAQESFKLVEYLGTKSDSSHENFIKGRSDYFTHARIVHWRSTVIELAKLFSGKKNDRYNLKRLLNALKNDGMLADAKVPETAIKHWEELIEKEKEAIENLIVQRDKVYAHTDEGYREVINKVTTSKTKELLEIVYGIVKDIYYSTYNSDFMFEGINYDPTGDLKHLIQIVANVHKAEDDYLNNYKG